MGQAGYAHARRAYKMCKLVKRHTGRRELKGLLELCQQKAIERGYVVTKALDDFGPVGDLPESGPRVLRIPAPLLCYWMGESELA